MISKTHFRNSIHYIRMPIVGGYGACVKQPTIILQPMLLCGFVVAAAVVVVVVVV